MLKIKLDTFEKFHQEYPGFAGFLPSLSIDNGKVKPLHENWNVFSSSDNGQLFWSIYGLI
jgi:hypothetical protein